MKNIFAVVFVFFFLNSYSQNLDSLDRKNGFKDLKLGMAYSKLSSNLIYVKTLKDNSKVYSYSGICCNKLFDYNLSSVQLTFFNDKIIAIYLRTTPFTISGKNSFYSNGSASPAGESFDYSKDWTKYKEIVANFSLLFGTPGDTEYPKTYCLQFDQWEGKNVILESTFWYEETTYVAVMITDKNFKQNNIKSGF